MLFTGDAVIVADSEGKLNMLESDFGDVYQNKILRASVGKKIDLIRGRNSQGHEPLK